MRIVDKNKILCKNFNQLLDACGGDKKQAREIHKILSRSYRKEKELDALPYKYKIAVIEGVFVRLGEKYKYLESHKHPEEKTEDNRVTDEENENHKYFAETNENPNPAKRIAY